jgi:hypothetical protein
MIFFFQLIKIIIIKFKNFSNLKINYFFKGMKQMIPSFMNRMFASPETLLMMSLRNDDYSRCKNIIKMYGLESNLAESAFLAEHLHKVVVSMQQDRFDKSSLGIIIFFFLLF